MKQKMIVENFQGQIFVDRGHRGDGAAAARHSRQHLIAQLAYLVTLRGGESARDRTKEGYELVAQLPERPTAPVGIVDGDGL